jgi:hypothetical protein
LCEPDSQAARLFDGRLAPAYPELPTSPPEFAKEGAIALLGETVDVHERPATLRLTPSAGRNLAVLGTRTAEACAILSAAGRALARQHEPGEADFFVACFDADAIVDARKLASDVRGSLFCDPSSFVDLLGSLASPSERSSSPQRVTYLFCYAGDRLPAGRELLRSVLDNGPLRRTHTLAWWRSVAALRDDLGGAGARLNPIGAWVALDVPGPDLAPLSTQPGGPIWHPRPQRGLYYDRAAHRAPEILIPYEADL